MSSASIWIFLIWMLLGLLRNLFFFIANGGGKEWNVEWRVKDVPRGESGGGEAMPDAFAMSMMMEQD